MILFNFQVVLFPPEWRSLFCGSVSSWVHTLLLCCSTHFCSSAPKSSTWPPWSNTSTCLSQTSPGAPKSAVVLEKCVTSTTGEAPIKQVTAYWFTVKPNKWKDVNLFLIIVCNPKLLLSSRGSWYNLQPSVRRFWETSCLAGSQEECRECSKHREMYNYRMKCCFILSWRVTELHYHSPWIA